MTPFTFNIAAEFAIKASVYRADYDKLYKSVYARRFLMYIDANP